MYQIIGSVRNRASNDGHASLEAANPSMNAIQNSHSGLQGNARFGSCILTETDSTIHASTFFPLQKSTSACGTKVTHQNIWR